MINAQHMKDGVGVQLFGGPHDGAIMLLVLLHGKLPHRAGMSVRCVACTGDCAKPCVGTPECRLAWYVLHTDGKYRFDKIEQVKR